ncbi:MAG: ATP synthase F0 subunit B [Candidatus Liptonbacteria bacterium]|nr:ATP synthase F0 subunit B [Candidatus Liptonbacteria bacterium]
MNELLSQLGIDWRLLLSQAVNFGLLVIILTFFAYKPLLRLMKERERKIKEGLAKAEEAEAQLKEAHTLKIQKLKEADAEALTVLQQADARAKAFELKCVETAKQKEAELVANAERLAKAEQEKVEQEMRREAVTLVKEALVKTVELNPKAVDEALITRAVEQVARANK